MENGQGAGEADTVLAEVVVRLVRRASGQVGVLVAHDVTKPVLALSLLEDGVNAVKQHHLAQEKANMSQVVVPTGDLVQQLCRGPRTGRG